MWCVLCAVCKSVLCVVCCVLCVVCCVLCVVCCVLCVTGHSTHCSASCHYCLTKSPRTHTKKERVSTGASPLRWFLFSFLFFCASLGYLPSSRNDIVTGYTLELNLACSYAIAARQKVRLKMVKGERAEAPVLCRDVSFRLDQKTENFKVVPAIIKSSVMQRSVLTEEKQKNQLGASCANRVRSFAS